MFIFVPPSEGKTVPTDARPVVIGSLALPGLASTRRVLVEALVRLSAGPADTALTVLGLTRGQIGELTHNRAVAEAPTAAVADLYSGVLYDALDLPGLREEDPAAFRRAEECVLVFSGLWGVLRPEDRVPRYRCSAGVKLPAVGSVTAVWRGPLSAALAGLVGDRLVVDLRSAAYAGMWRAGAGADQGRVVAVRVLRERVVRGVVERSVVSHFNKATKGRLARALLVSGAEPKTSGELVDALRDLDFTVEATGPRALDVIVTEV
jgi:cytoplasmic iron level regulating protein YaaA (DUF328/UPF0246 family)